MRWIDIILPEPETHQKLDSLLAEAESEARKLNQIQDKHGLDNVKVVEHMATVGGLLFKAVTTLDPQAFNPAKKQGTSNIPAVGDAEYDNLVGYHLVIDTAWPVLPWTWLHNGLEFILDKNPVVTSNTPSRLPAGKSLRPWMQRCRRAEFLLDDEGASSLAGTLDQIRPEQQANPEFLFVPGHTDEKIRRMIYREAEAIESALETTTLGEPLATLRVPGTPITPDELCNLSLTFQALHFAGPVSMRAESESGQDAGWMDRLAEELNAVPDQELEDAMGLEGEVLGVDPITSLLDDVSQKYDQGQLAGAHGHGQNADEKNAHGRSGKNSSAAASSPRGGSSPWLLEDGPVDPESLGRAGGIPPLVYSNSYCALPELGPRFLAAGASAFVGPMVPLFSRPARIFSGYCYQALGEGWCVGAAVWRAARNCRQELGPEHPAWLSYGVHGYGSLALHYL